MTLEYFKKMSNMKHSFYYDYSKVENIVNNKTKIPIICPRHGSFYQRPNDHLNGSGCSKCKYFISKGEKEWLDYCNIMEENRQKIFILNKKRIRVDGFDPKTNTVYEFLGDYFHGNLRKYDDEVFNIIKNKTMKELNMEVWTRFKLLEENGLNVVFMWEQDWNELKVANIVI